MYNFVCKTKLVVTHVCEYECMELCVCTASRKTDECNCSIGSVVQKMVRQKEC